MTEEGFLHKAFLGQHVDLPVHFCDTVEAIVPTLEKAVADVPRAGAPRPPPHPGV